MRPAALPKASGEPGRRKGEYEMGFAARTAALAVALVVWVAAPSGASAGDWPQFRHDLSHSGTNPDEATIGVGNVAGLQTMFTGATGSLVESSPAMANGVVYVG